MATPQSVCFAQNKTWYKADVGVIIGAQVCAQHKEHFAELGGFPEVFDFQAFQVKAEKLHPPKALFDVCELDR